MTATATQWRSDYYTLGSTYPQCTVCFPSDTREAQTWWPPMRLARGCLQVQSHECSSKDFHRLIETHAGTPYLNPAGFGRPDATPCNDSMFMTVYICLAGDQLRGQEAAHVLTQLRAGQAQRVLLRQRRRGLLPLSLFSRGSCLPEAGVLRTASGEWQTRVADSCARLVWLHTTRGRL